MFDKLATNGYGKRVTQGKKEGFIKYYPLTQAQLDDLGLSRVQYKQALMRRNKDVSESQLKWLMGQGGEEVERVIRDECDGNKAGDGEDQEQEEGADGKQARNKRVVYNNLESSRTRTKRHKNL